MPEQVRNYRDFNVKTRQYSTEKKNVAPGQEKNYLKSLQKNAGRILRSRPR
jgi:hypothetical protein